MARQKELTNTKLIDMLKTMNKIRVFEEKADQLFALGKVHGTMHLSIGMEATATGAIFTLRPDDYITSTHRGHGHCIAKGGDLKRMMAEFMGKETGYCRGRGGSMHIADVGAALGVKLNGTTQVVLGFFGDGAANLGIFHESMNLAAIWTLPVVYVCENNQYAMSMSVARAFPIKDIAERACA